jgi:tetrahydromethanopterin S-methyltransferase subunit A
MKGKWFEIIEEVKEEVDASGFQQKWSLDPKGYFLIRTNKDSKIIEVGHCTNDHKLVRIIRGKTSEEIMYKMLDMNLISLMDHAAYLGKELQKAFLSLKLGFEYVQDPEFCPLTNS